jgi:hypothetical protein
MTELERELRGLAAAIDFPETPEIATAVDLQGQAQPRRTWSRHVAWAAVAILVVAVGAALVVPQARTGILHLFGVGSVRVELVDKLPEVRPDAPLVLGTAVDPDRAPSFLLRPTVLGEPDGIYREGPIVTLLYGAPERVKLLVTEIEETGLTPGIGKKLAASGTRVEFVSVRGATGSALWIAGSPHVVELPGGPRRLAANTLIWARGPLTLRLEGAASRQQAVAVANSFR